MGAQPWDDQRGLIYGIAIYEQDKTTNTVLRVQCIFCALRSQDEMESHPMPKNINSRMGKFRSPFRYDKIRKHVLKHHKCAYFKYLELSDREKLEYAMKITSIHNENQLTTGAIFNAHEPAVISKTAYDTFQLNTRNESPKNEISLVFHINGSIVDVILGEILCYANDVFDRSREDMLGIFKVLGDASARWMQDGQDIELNGYIANINTRHLFHDTVKYFACSNSIQAMKTFMRDVNCTVERNSELTTMYPSVICAASLQGISKLLEEQWAFALALTFGSNRTSTYLDWRVRVLHSGENHDLHLLAFPLYDEINIHDIAETIFDVLDVIAPRWRTQLVGVITEGDISSTVWASTLVSKTIESADPGVCHVCCTNYQLQVVVENKLELVLDDKFLYYLTPIVTWLRRQSTLQDQIGECPKLQDTRWVSMKQVVRYLQSNRIAIIQHLDAKHPPCRPPMIWWIKLFVADSITIQVDMILKHPRGFSTRFHQQRCELERLLQSLIMMCPAQVPVDAETIQLIQHDPNCIVHGHYYMELEDVKRFIQDDGLFVNAHDTISHESLTILYQSIAKLFIELISGIASILANSGDAIRVELPNVVPYDLCQLSTFAVSVMIQRFKPRLIAAGWSRNDLEDIETDHRALLKAYYDLEPSFKATIDTNKGGVVDFEQGWIDCRSKLPKLYGFCSGLASMYPGISSKTHVAIDDWQMNENSILNFSLETILHAKQLNTLQEY